MSQKCVLLRREDENRKCWTQRNELLKEGFRYKDRRNTSLNLTASKSDLRFWSTGWLWCMACILSGDVIVPKRGKLVPEDPKILKYYNGLWPSKGPQYIHSTFVILKFHGSVWGKMSKKYKIKTRLKNTSLWGYFSQLKEKWVVHIIIYNMYISLFTVDKI